MLHLLLIIASLTTYLDGDVSTVYVLKTNQSVFKMPVQGEVVYALSDKGDVEYELHDGILTLHGNNQSFFIVKVRSKMPASGDIKEYVYYNPGIDVSDYKVYLPNNSTVLNVYPPPDVEGNPMYWHKNSSIYSVKYKVQSAEDDNLLFILTGLAVIAIVAYLLRRMYLTKTRDIKSFENKIAGFNEYEKEILRIVMKNPGIRQRDIAIKLGLKKSHASKLLSKMEARFLIKRERFGRVIKVHLGEFFDKKAEVSKVSTY